MKFVTEVEPSVVDTFERTAPQQVVEAVRVTVSSLLGSLPAQFFEVNIVTLGDNLRSLMYSFLMTGYLYRHISDKLDLQGGVARSLPGGVLADDLPQDARAPGRRRGRHAQALYGYAEVRPPVTLRAVCDKCDKCDRVRGPGASRARADEEPNRYHHLSTDAP